MAGNKNNIFDHVLYEFEMYIDTYLELLKPYKQLFRNIILESHSVHLRNLIEFFNCDGQGNCIDTEMILKKELYDFTVSDDLFVKLGVKQYINKSIDHLTPERFKWDGMEKDLEERQSKIPSAMFPLFTKRIKAFLKLLLDVRDVKPKYQEDCKNEEIIMRIQRLLSLLNDVPDEAFNRN